MSISRFSGDSDVYMYENASGKFECCGCRMRGGKFAILDNAGEALDHLLKHRDEGHKVLQEAVDELRGGTRVSSNVP